MSVSYSVNQINNNDCEICSGSGVDPCNEPYPDDLFLIYPDVPRCRACHEQDEKERTEELFCRIDAY